MNASRDDVPGKNDMKENVDVQSETFNDTDEKVIWKCDVGKFETDNKQRFDRHKFESVWKICVYPMQARV